MQVKAGVGTERGREGEGGRRGLVCRASPPQAPEDAAASPRCPSAVPALSFLLQSAHFPFPLLQALALGLACSGLMPAFGSL